MTIRLKIFFCLSALALAIWSGMAFMVTQSTLSHFDAIDRERVTRSLNRVLEHLQARQETLSVVLAHWLVALQADAPDSGLVLLKITGMEQVARVEDSGIVTKFYKLGESRADPTPTEAADLARLALQAQQREGQARAVLGTSGAPLLAAAVSNDRTTAVGGISLDARFESELNRSLLVDFQFLPPVGADFERVLAKGGDAGIFVEMPADGSQDVVGFAILRGLEGNPLVMIQIKDLRHSHIEALAQLRFFLGSSGAGAIGLVLLATLAAEILFGSRIHKLVASVKRADTNGMEDLPPSLLKGRDEIAILARSARSTINRLKTAQALYRAIVETQEELILRYTPDGKVTLANEAFARSINSSARAVVGKNLDKILPREANPLANQRPENGQATTIELPMEGESGPRQILWTQKAILTSNREVEEIQAIGQDVTLLRNHEIQGQEARDQGSNGL